MSHPRHCSDADLLALLDGELPLGRRLRADWHLSRCWQCRARRAELDQQAQAFARAVAADTFPSPGRIADARISFEGRRKAWPSVRPQPARPRVWLALSCAAGVVAAMAGWWSMRSPLEPTSESRPVPSPLPFLAAPSAAVAVAPVSRPVVVTTNPAPAPVAPVDWNALEVDVHYRLHRIGACGAEPVLVTRNVNAGPIVVSAIGPPELREKEIRLAMADLLHKGMVRFDVTPLTQSPVTTEALGDSSNSGRGPKLDQRAQAILREVDSIYAHAWAMHRHTALGAGRLDRNTGWLLDAMRREHVAELKPAGARLRAELGSLLPPGTPVAATATEFEAAKELAEITHRLFAPTPGQPEPDRERDGERLAALLARF